MSRPENALRDQNNVPALMAASNAGDGTVVELEADPATGRLLVNASLTGSITASNPSVGTNTATAPTSSTEIGIIDGSGNLQGVSSTNPLPVSATFSTSTSTTNTNTSVGGSNTSVTILASNTSRKGATIYNDSSAILYLALISTASTTAYNVQMTANSYYEVPYAYTGVISGIWASSTGNARVNELT
jgi:hypothetical protein